MKTTNISSLAISKAMQLTTSNSMAEVSKLESGIGDRHLCRRRPRTRHPDIDERRLFPGKQPAAVDPRCQRTCRAAHGILAAGAGKHVGLLAVPAGLHHRAQRQPDSSSLQVRRPTPRWQRSRISSATPILRSTANICSRVSARTCRRWTTASSPISRPTSTRRLPPSRRRTASHRRRRRHRNADGAVSVGL